MDHYVKRVRCKSPAMVRREFWTMVLGYNLVRKVICEAAAFGGVLPRRLSFTRTCAFLLEVSMFWALSGIQEKQLESMLKHLAKMLLPERPGRYEPRMVKRRLDKYPVMKQPRQILKNDVNLDEESIQ